MRGPTSWFKKGCMAPEVGSSEVVGPHKLNQERVRGPISWFKRESVAP